jgi:hypothetical protein
MNHKLLKLLRASWRERLARLGAFGGQRVEKLVHRLSARRSPERRLERQISLPRRGDGLPAERLLARARRESPVRFFLPAGREEAAAEIARRFPEVIGSSLEEAERIYGGEYRLFEAVNRLDGYPHWSRDPSSGFSWPLDFYQDLDIFDRRGRGVDIKYVWELNRHQFLVPLAKAYWLTGEERFAARALALIEHWIDSNPYKLGVNWTSALEAAFRSISWSWVYQFLLHSQAMTPELHSKLLGSLGQHGDYLSRHLSLYFSPYNHLIGELCGLLLTGSLFPMLRRAGRWQAKAWKLLEAEVEKQFHPDGGSVEQSMFYHHATLGFYLLAVLCRRRQGEGVPRRVLDRLEKALEFTLLMSKPGGGLPMTGDIDDGRSIRVGRPAFHWDFKSFLSVGAVLFGRGDMKAQAGGFHEDALWLLGLEGWRAFEALEPAPLRAPSAILPASGYAVLRSDASAEANVLFFDCGEQAAGLHRDATPSAAHGHADCLAIEAVAGGAEILVDSGLHRYGGDPAWRDHFRKTRAHNTVVVGGRDQALHLGGMDWCRTYRAEIESWISTPLFDYVRGSHDGYLRSAGASNGSAGGVVHRRAVFFRKPDYWLVVDELDGTGVHELQSWFHAAPGVRIEELPGGGFDLLDPSGKRLALFSAGASLEARVGFGSEADPASGWVAPGYGRKEPAALLVLEGRLEAPALWCTLLCARPGALQVRDGQGWLVLETSEYQDSIVVEGAGLPEAEGVRTDARLACVRRRAGGALDSICMIGGSRLEIAGKLRFCSQRPLEHAVLGGGGLSSVSLHPEVDFELTGGLQP